jgi:N-acetylneuraminate synthase
MRLVEVAARAGADAVKFQTFRAEALATARAAKADYQARNEPGAESQLDMLRRLQLDPGAHHELMAECARRKIDFLSTPFDLASLRFLTDDLGLETLKFSSGDLTNGPLLLEGARRAQRLILSTGMATLAEVEQALSVIAFACVAGSDDAPGRTAFERAYASPEGRAALRDRVCLLHCTTEYPAPLADVNLRAMATLRQAFGLTVGYSDHTEGIAVTTAAAALGARVIEKHFTLDRTLPGPDHKASLEPTELAAMVTAIRAVEQSLGDGVKVPSAVERANATVARKSLVALAPIRAGEAYTADNVGIMRPGGGRSPMDYWDLLGETADTEHVPQDFVGVRR